MSRQVIGRERDAGGDKPRRRSGGRMPQLPDWDLTPPFETLVRARPRPQTRPASAVEKAKVATAAEARPSQSESDRPNAAAAAGAKSELSPKLEADTALSDEMERAASAGDAEVSLEVAAQAEAQFCTDCGHRLEADAFFCDECGAAR